MAKTAIIAIVIVVIVIAVGALYFTKFSGMQNHTTTIPHATTTVNSNALNTTSSSSVNTSVTTTVAGKPVYNYVFNGDFSTGSFAGWTTNNTGFGSAPLNITKANNQQCYIGAPWTGYAGTYFATTFTCGTAVSPGNLTSSYFTAHQAYLNFRIISQQSAGLYVAVVYNGKQVIRAYYNTYNSSYGSTGSYTFRNASIPLYPVLGKAVQIEVVADTLQQQQFIAAGDFALSQSPNLSPGITVNITNS